MPTALTLEGGSRLALGDRIGRGGEGDVHLIVNDPRHVVKLYTVADLESRRDKVLAMVRAKLATTSNVVAFPVAIVNKNGRFAGFTMQRIAGRKPLHEIYSPGARKASFPSANYKFLVHAAANAARAVGSVHQTGCVIGDINHSSMLISNEAKVALIDADSFQYTEAGRRHTCSVGVPEYTPPELQGLQLQNVDRRPEHDNFGLAIVIFQLLFMGRHPFSGAYFQGEMPLERAIAEHRFAYSQIRQVGMKPPPAVPTLADVPKAVAQAFEAAFASGSMRPSAKQWMNLLVEFEKDLRPCSNSSLHHYATSAKECPWCRMEASAGIPLFLPPVLDKARPTTPDANAFKFNLAGAWAAIEAVPPPSIAISSPQLPLGQLVRSDRGRAARGTRAARRLVGVMLLSIAATIFYWAAGLWYVYLALGWYGFSRLFGEDDDTAALRKEKNTVESLFNGAMKEWNKHASSNSFDVMLSELQNDKLTFEKLPEAETKAISEYQRNRKAEQLKAYLGKQLIRRHKIRGIGDARLATLLAYGVETAFDVSLNKIQNIPGFGPGTAAYLVDWRRRMEARFVYDERPNEFDATRLAAIKSETLEKANDLRRRLLSGPAELRKRREAIETFRRSPAPHLIALHTELRQLEVDLKG